MQLHRLISLSSVTLACLLLVGCSKAPDTLNSEYHQRLQSQLTLPNLTPYSDSQKLEKAKLTQHESNTISILQLAKIQHCQLGQLIAEHNSQLGKVASASGQFAYQVNFLQLLPKCVSTLQDETLKAALTKVQKEKSDLLFNYLQQLIFNDKQLATLYQASSNSLLEINEDAKQATHNTLQYLMTSKNALVSGEIDSINITELEHQLAGLFKNPYLPSLLRALYEQIHLLEQQTNALERFSFESLCKPGHNNERALILSNIFSKFYGKHIQQYHNLLLREYAFISPSLNIIWQDQNGNPYESSLNVHPLNLAQTLKAASVKHVRWWQSLYKQCGIVPGG